MTTTQAWQGSARSRAVAWSLVGIAGLSLLTLCVLDLRWDGWRTLVVDAGSAVMLVVVFVGLGTLLSLREPSNPIGWLLTAGGLTWMTLGFAETAARHGLSDGRHLTTATALAAHANENMWVVGMLCSVGLPLLLFPVGRTRSRRWHRVLVAMVCGCALTLLGSSVSDKPVPNLVVGGPPVANPLGVASLHVAASVARGLGVLLILVTISAAAVGIALRFRASSGIVRQQLRWVRAGALLAAAGMLSVFIGGGLLGLPAALINTLVTVGIGCVPLSITVAVLRYRLYDLDRVVSRTVTYGAVTGLLIAVYVGLVTAVSRLTPSGSSLAVATSTLAVAALFQPVRRRVQHGVDRRFNRSRYDADRTVDAFRLRLREEVDLGAVRTELLTVAQQTLQPASAALWLRDGTRT